MVHRTSIKATKSISSWFTSPSPLLWGFRSKASPKSRWVYNHAWKWPQYISCARKVGFSFCQKTLSKNRGKWLLSEHWKQVWLQKYPAHRWTTSEKEFYQQGMMKNGTVLFGIGWAVCPHCSQRAGFSSYNCICKIFICCLRQDANLLFLCW